jgi:SulP family sulfate permease
MMVNIKPKLFSLLKTYNFKKFKRDFKAGFIVAIIALPLSMAFAMSCGLPPEQGVYTSIIGGIIVAILGGSRVQIAGPTGAFVMIIQLTTLQYGVTGLVLATIMAGGMLIIMGVVGVGKFIKYIPSPITTGFTSGIALIIFTSQIVDFLGLKVAKPQISFIAKWKSYWGAINTINPTILIVGIITVAFMFIWPKFVKKIPNSFAVLVLGTAIVFLFKIDIPILGQISKIPTMPSLSNVNFELLADLVSPAFTIALLVAMQALLSAVVTDGMISSHHNANSELVAQGVANIACGLFGCMPSTGGVARSIANAKNGARSPIAALVHSVVLLVFMLFLLPIIKFIPRVLLAGIIIHVTYNMFNFKNFFSVFKTTKSDASIMLVTFFLTVIVSLITAIQVGMIMAAILLVMRLSDSTKVVDITEDFEEDENREYIIFSRTKKKIKKEKIIIYEINGPFFFGAANAFVSGIKPEMKKAEYFVLRMKHVPFIDMTAYIALNSLYQLCVDTHTQMIITNLNEQPRTVLTRQGFIDKLDEKHIYNKLDDAIIALGH